MYQIPSFEPVDPSVVVQSYFFSLFASSGVSFFMCSLLKASFDEVHVIGVCPAAVPQWSCSIKHRLYRFQMDS